ncbi:MAG: hypothetical protein ACLFUE_02400 [Desulfobacteraceae bacterium]
MTALKKAVGVLIVLIISNISLYSAVYAHLPEHLQHDIEAAQLSFETRCTQCHSSDTAVSARAYRDWLTGISQRHGKGLGWIPDDDAEKIFLHLIVHLEPKSKTAVKAGMVEPKKNRKVQICLVGGLTSLGLLIATVLFGHSKRLRRRWFKGHRYFAFATLIIAVTHGLYCFYIFTLN